MKVLRPSVVMLTPDRQIDRRILLSADSLESAGWEVTIIAMPLDKKAVDDRRVLRIGSNIPESKKEDTVLGVYRWIRGHIPMNGRLMRWLKRLTWRYLVDQESFYTKLFFNTASKFTPNVFVANDLPMLPLGQKLAKACGARLVYDSHELYTEQEFSVQEKRRWTEIESKYIDACDLVITVNKSIAIELEQRYGVSDVKVIHNAERTSVSEGLRRKWNEIFNLPVDTKIVLFQGGLSAGRNLEVLMRSMTYLKNFSIVLVVLGDGIMLRQLQKMVKKENLHGRVYFHPAVPQNKLLTFTAAADAGLIPYQATCLNNYYCTPNKLFEFIAAGIPILATDLPEIKKLVGGMQIGLVGDTSTPEKLAELLDDFFSDEKRFKTWKKNVSAALKVVSWEQEEKKLIEIYEALR